jgi:hypothetical protein
VREEVGIKKAEEGIGREEGIKERRQHYKLW